LVTSVLADPVKLQAMSQAARALDVPDAAKRICERIEKRLARA
jgi:UDP-N-acetylglucosamine:LPS N-acetylglucosamine transferase